MRMVLLGGSLRAGSLNRRFLEYLAVRLRAEGHEVTTFVGDDLRLPFYEEGLKAPEPVVRMQAALQRAQGLLLVSPEYNASMPAPLKNVVDWLSVVRPNPLSGMPVLLAGCSPGALGGTRSLVIWRSVLANAGAMALPAVLSVPLADTNLDADGAPTDRRTQALMNTGLASFVELAPKLRG